MGQYTPVGPFVQGGSPPINKTFLDGVENALVAGGMIYFITPYHLTTNPTVNSGATTTLTCTGVGGIPTGAKGVLLNIGIFAVNVQGGYVQIYPTGATAGLYVNFTANGPTNSFSATAVPVPLSAGGQITVKANSSNIVLQDWYIFGYVI
jgi:hypothetical protein